MLLSKSVKSIYYCMVHLGMTYEIVVYDKLHRVKWFLIIAGANSSSINLSVTSVYPAVSGCLNQQSWSWASYVGRWKNRGRQRWLFRLSGKDWRSTSTCLKHTSSSTSKTATLRRTCAWRLPRNAVSVWSAAYLEHPLMHLSGHSVIMMVFS